MDSSADESEGQLQTTSMHTKLEMDFNSWHTLLLEICDSRSIFRIPEESRFKSYYESGLSVDDVLDDLVDNPHLQP